MRRIELGERVGGVELGALRDGHRDRLGRPRSSAPSASAGRCGRSRADGPTRSSSAPTGTAARALDHITSGSGAPEADLQAGRAQLGRQRRARAVRLPGGGGPAMSIRAPGLEWTITPGRGRSDSIRITAATTRSGPKRARSVARCSTPLSSGTTSGGRGSPPGPAHRRAPPPWWRRSGSRRSPPTGRRLGTGASNSPSSGLVTRRPPAVTRPPSAVGRSASHRSRAWARAPATKPPTPPGPSTAILSAIAERGCQTLAGRASGAEPRGPRKLTLADARPDTLGPEDSLTTQRSRDGQHR